MIRLRSIRRLGILILLCISCVAVMSVLAFADRDRDAGENKGEETIVGWMIDQVAAGEVELSDEDSIRQAISEGERKFEISLTEENKDRIVGFIRKLDTIETGAGDYIDQAKQLYLKYSSELVEGASDAIGGAVKNAAKAAVESFFQSLIPKRNE